MLKRYSKMLAILCCMTMVMSLLIPVSFAAETDSIENLETVETPTAIFGTPQLGSNDPLWDLTMEHSINKSTVPDDPRPHATGTARILWDNEYVYARVVVQDSNLYQGAGGDHQYDSLEFYVGTGSNGSNQWRVSSTGVFSGQSDAGRAAWTQITDTGYIVEMRIPSKGLTSQPGNLTFEVYINNSTANGGDRYEVVSAFGTPDAAYSSSQSFIDSLELIEANEVDTRFSIITTAGPGGKITPTVTGNVYRIDRGTDVTFTIHPDFGKVVDTVTVDSNPVTLSDGHYTFINVEANHTIHATFKNDTSAEILPFTVWNDNFASGEYTTAVIIDLGEGRAANSSDLDPSLFTVSGKNTTMDDTAITYEGTRKITRVYVNDEPNVLGYVGSENHSPDYKPGLTSGRYIIVEFEFYTATGGKTTLDGSSNSTKQIYNIVQNSDIVLTDGNPLSFVVFEQQNVVNPILDKFTSHTTNSVNYALYLHKNENGEEMSGLPLYVYTHGMSRGGTMSQFDQKASMKSANGSVALMKKIEENPQKYASHILNISYNGTSTPSIEDVKLVIDSLVASGKVDPNRIYAAGFSWGGRYTNSLVNSYPGFFAAAAPMAPVGGSPEANTDELHKDIAYWMFVNAHNTGIYQTNLDSYITTNMPKMTKALASRFESNEALTWPYNQYDQPSQRPNPDNTPQLQDYIAHEVEASVLYNQITMENPINGSTWSIAPIAQSPSLPTWDNDYSDVFDWMFSQTKQGVLPGAPSAIFGTPELGSNDQLWNLTMEHAINKSTIPDDPRPNATGTARILWDNDYIYARVVVEDSDVYQGSGGDHTYDSVEFFVGSGSSGSNQWRVSSTGVFSGQSHTDRAAWTEITDTGYIVEVRIPKRSLTLEPGKFTFEVNINNSTKNGADRYEVVSAFGTPDTGFNSDAAFRDSLELITANQADNRHSVTLSVATGGTVTPNAPGNVLRIAPSLGIAFTITPDTGKIVDTVTVNGEAVAVTDNTFSVQNITADLKINVTFKDDPAAEQLPFIVWNDNFASGEYTTAVIIDLGEGNKAVGSELNPDLFTVSARNTTLVDDLVAFEGTRKIARVYANDEPKVRGYSGKVHNSPDYQPGIESGRYIVIELEFYTEVGGNTTLTGSNSTKQNYNVVLKDDIVLTEGDSIDYAVFKQDKVVNPILDKFTAHTSSDEVNYALYIHKDENNEVIEGLPLFVYTHGFSRGGTQAHIDQKASMKSANGAVALMKRMEQDSAKYASHVLNISYSGGNAPQVGNIKKIIDELVAEGLVNADRIYASGFSMGGGVTTNLIGNFPGFFAAAAPLGISSGWPSVSTDEAHKDLAYWIFVNTYDSGASNIDNAAEGFKELTNARASRFDSNEALTWPYNQYDQPSQRPNLDNEPPLQRHIAHEVEAAVLYNQITMTNPLNGNTWSIAPIAQSPSLPAWDNDYTDIFDWMFSQKKQDAPSDVDVPGAPINLKATAGNKQVTLSWTAPTNDGGSAILGYKVWYNDVNPVTLDAEVNEYTFTGLTNGQSYTFKVVAVNAKGDSVAISATATPTSTPTPTPTPTIPYVPNPTDGNSGNPGTGTDAVPSISDYTVNTPKDKPAVKDSNGNITLPGGGEITTKSGMKIEVPEGTTIDSNGKVTIPAGKTAKVIGNSTVTIPAGSTIQSDGTIVVGQGGANIVLNNGLSLNILAGSELMFNDNNPLGFIVMSGNPFKDVNKNSWFHSYVNIAYTYSLFNGTSSTTFDPGSSVTRAMFVQVLANLEKINSSDYTGSSFSDVKDGQWYTAAIEWAANNGIVNGVNADQFDPNATVTREQMLVILHNYMKYKGYEIPESTSKSFADESEISSWALESVHAMQSIGIVLGRPDNRFDNKSTSTRAEVATIFVRFIEYLAKQ